MNVVDNALLLQMLKKEECWGHTVTGTSWPVSTKYSVKVDEVGVLDRLRIGSDNDNTTRYLSYYLYVDGELASDDGDDVVISHTKDIEFDPPLLFTSNVEVKVYANGAFLARYPTLSPSPSGSDVGIYFVVKILDKKTLNKILPLIGLPKIP